MPDWLVVGFSLTFAARSHEPGRTPEQTCLRDEGCGDLSQRDLLEAWSRHCLVGLHDWEQDGVARLHREWSGLLHGIGQPVSQSGRTGLFLGIDEDLGMLVRSDRITHLVPLTALLETQS